MYKRLEKIYGSKVASQNVERFELLLEEYKVLKKYKKKVVNHKTTYLITYGDSFYQKGVKTLKTLDLFANKYLSDFISDIHILPMFEYTSDDGFSVVDYKRVDPRLGDFEDLNELAKSFDLMYDFVVNHISQSSDWFKKYLEEDPKYQQYFIAYDPEFDYSNVVRPRTSELISRFENGKTAWTTFSKDQVDLNIKNIDVLYDLTEVLLYYIKYGASSIRLDAIGFLYKESGNSCIHHENTHEVIKMFRDIINYFEINTQLITETNVPHLENISYFGNGSDEANQVYQFALPPLTLHTFVSGDSSKLSEFTKTIGYVSKSATYFNFLASHDGIGMRPVESILSDDERSLIFDKVASSGGKFNYKSNVDGSKSVYEMNITFYDALSMDDGLDVKRFVAAHGILAGLPGVAAIYYQSILGSRNFEAGVLESGINRRINREKFDYDVIVNELGSCEIRSSVYKGISNLFKVRSQFDAFDPFSKFEVLDLGRKVFAVRRFGSAFNIVVVVNVTNGCCFIDMQGYDVLDKYKFNGNLLPYQVVFIKEDK